MTLAGIDNHQWARLGFVFLIVGIVLLRVLLRRGFGPNRRSGRHDRRRM